MAHPSPMLLQAWIIFLAAGTLHLVTPTSAAVSTYIVHMDKSVMPAAFSDHGSWYASTLSAAAGSSRRSSDDAISNDPNLIYVYNNAIHGFSTRLSPPQLEQLKKSHGFLSCYRDVPVKTDTTHTSEFLHLNPNSGLWPASNYGEGVIVGVVDTGVWPESESYRDDGMPEVPSRWKGTCEEGIAFNSSLCNKKLIGARYFNRGLSASDPNLTIAVNSTRDTEGHGTHTSSTAAGNYVGGVSYFGYARGTSRGMAPRAHVAMYKALWDEGATASDILAAMDRAISDGVDVISLSLGIDDTPLYADPIAIGAYAAMEKGIFVSTSTGNVGPSLTTLHNGAPWLLTVGASTVDRKFAGIVDLGDGTSVIGASLYLGSPSLAEHPLVFMKACDNETSLRQVRDKIVVCENTSSVFHVESAKVAGGVFISPKQSSLAGRLSFPGALLNPQEGKAILEYIARSPNPKASLRFRETILGTKPEPTVAAYTSRGPSRSCPNVLKPDLVAPGSLVFASWAENRPVGVIGSRPVFGPYNIVSGSSMSCPHAAGVAALLRAAHPGWSPAAIRSAMVTTADPLDNVGGLIRDSGDGYKPASPLIMGSGHLDPNKALDPGLVYDAGVEDYTRLLCAMNYTEQQIKTVTRSSHYDNCSEPSLDLNYPSFIAYFDPNASSSLGGVNNVVREFRRTVTNVADGGWTYTARLTSMVFTTVTVEPDELVFTEKYEKKSFILRVIRGHEGMEKDEVDYGSLSWVDEQGKHVVRSPIVATTLSWKAL